MQNAGSKMWRDPWKTSNTKNQYYNPWPGQMQIAASALVVRIRGTTSQERLVVERLPKSELKKKTAADIRKPVA